jgi:hypothetical protein
MRATRRSGGADRQARTIALAVVLLGNALLLGHFYDRFCWPPDDGHYAHLAERVLDGETLHVDIEDFHTDHSHAVNALAFALLGRDLRSLRVPLVIVTLAQSLLVFWLFRTRTSRTAAIAALATSALSFVQYLNPQPHWYCLALAITTAAVLAAPRRWRISYLVALGALIATAFLFRQLTGVFLALAVVGHLLLAGPPAPEPRGASTAASRLLSFLMAVAILAYCARVADLVGFLLFGLWPAGLLLWGAARCRVTPRQLARMTAGLGTGAVLATMPTVIYHAWHGALAAWFRDCVLNAVAVEHLPYIGMHRYAAIMAAAFAELRDGGPADELVNNLFWLVLPAFGVINGVSLFGRLPRVGDDAPAETALPYVAAFYGLVALFHQIPMYLYYTLGVLVPGVLWTRTARAPQRGSAWEAAVVAIGLVAVYFHAGQPATRTREALVNGTRVPLVENTRLPRATLWLEPRVIGIYGDLVERIARETRPEDAIFVLPNHPEVYFLAQRRNPFRFPNTSLAVRTPADLAEVLRELTDRPPALVIYAAQDRHRTAMSDAIMVFVAQRYERIATIGEFAVYRFAGARKGERGGEGRRDE